MNDPCPTVPPASDAAQLLRDLLEIVDSEAHVVCLATSPVASPGYIYRDGEAHKPTHVVLNCDGDVVGRGLSEDDAAADTIKNYHREALSWLKRYQSSVRAWKKASAALEELG